MTARSVRALLPCCLALVACEPADLGRGPEFLWWSDHESGSLSDWTTDGNGETWIAEGGSLETVTTYARSGSYSLRATVVASNTGLPSSALVGRRGGLPVEAYYSAWFYLPEAIDSTDYWLFFKFRSRSDPNVAATAIDLWDLDLAPDPALGMTVRLYHHDTGDAPALTSWQVPLRRWFQIEAFLRTANDASGRLTVWFDGVMLYDIAGRATAPSDFVDWEIGAATVLIAPSEATLYVDDAAITTQRLGASFPVFWRGS